MNIGERATIIVQTRSYDEVVDRAAAVLRSVALEQEVDDILGSDVAWILAATMLRSRINGSTGPRIVTRVMGDEIATDDGIG